VAELRKARPDVLLVESTTNLGYGGGANLGINAALESGADVVWLLNNDARPRTHTLTRGLRLFREAPEVGVISTNAVPFHLANAKIGNESIVCPGCEREFHEAEVLMGPSLMFRASVVAEGARFDERYFHYREEEDLVYRAFRAGWRVGLACRSLVDHNSGSTLPLWSPQARYYMIRNAILYDKWNQPGRFRTLRTLVAERRSIRASLALRKFHAGGVRRLRGVVLAIADGVRERYGRRDLGASYWRD
jgi:GT2 family glycosyltransferase